MQVTRAADGAGTAGTRSTQTWTGVRLDSAALALRSPDLLTPGPASGDRGRGGGVRAVQCHVPPAPRGASERPIMSNCLNYANHADISGRGGNGRGRGGCFKGKVLAAPPDPEAVLWAPTWRSLATDGGPASLSGQGARSRGRRPAGIMRARGLTCCSRGPPLLRLGPPRPLLPGTHGGRQAGCSCPLHPAAAGKPRCARLRGPALLPGPLAPLLRGPWEWPVDLCSATGCQDGALRGRACGSRPCPLDTEAPSEPSKRPAQGWPPCLPPSPPRLPSSLCFLENAEVLREVGLDPQAFVSCCFNQELKPWGRAGLHPARL